MAAAHDLTIRKGSTFSKVLRWESGTIVFKPVTGITAAAPPVVTATAHGLPDGWRVALTNVRGMTQINAAKNPPKLAEYRKVKVLTANTCELTAVDASGYSPYTSGGIAWYRQPTDLAGYTARMQIRESLDSATVLLALTTENSRIALDNTLKTITLTINATDTAAIAWASGVYDLEMVSPGGVVTALIEGASISAGEVTR